MTIRRAAEADIPAIEEILADAVRWMDENGLHRWEMRNVTWAALSRYDQAHDFYIACEGVTPAACMAVVDDDSSFWPDIPKGESLFLHKVAVKRAFAGRGISKQLIDFAKEIACTRGIRAIRLDCHQDRNKVRALYERKAFAVWRKSCCSENTRRSTSVICKKKAYGGSPDRPLDLNSVETLCVLRLAGFTTA